MRYRYMNGYESKNLYFRLARSCPRANLVVSTSLMHLASHSEPNPTAQAINARTGFSLMFVGQTRPLQNQGSILCLFFTSVKRHFIQSDKPVTDILDPNLICTHGRATVCKTVVLQRMEDQIRSELSGTCCQASHRVASRPSLRVDIFGIATGYSASLRDDACSSLLSY